MCCDCHILTDYLLCSSQNYHTKAALIILHSRVELPASFNKGSDTPRINRWVHRSRSRLDTPLQGLCANVDLVFLVQRRIRRYGCSTGIALDLEGMQRHGKATATPRHRNIPRRQRPDEEPELGDSGRQRQAMGRTRGTYGLEGRPCISRKSVGPGGNHSGTMENRAGRVFQRAAV
jgi:hypothetical protein